MNERMRAAVKAADGFDAVLITSEVSRRYLLEFDSTDGTLLLLPDDAVFIIDSRYIEAAQSKVADARVELQGSLYSQLAKHLAGSKRIAVEAALPVREVSAIARRMPGFEIVPCEAADNAIERLRQVKTKGEVASIRAAQAIAEKAFDHILGFIRPGVTDIEIAAELEYVMRRAGAERMSFDTIAISGAMTSMPHGVPTSKKVEPGDFVTMDYGAVVDGMHSDMTRTVAVGSVTDEMRTVYDTVLRAQEASLNALCAGLPCCDGDSPARTVIAQAGYGKCFGHATGHSVGYEIHERPTMSPMSAGQLEAGNVVTVEPGIYLPGRFGVRIEDMALITDSGCENLTNAKKELIIL